MTRLPLVPSQKVKGTKGFDEVLQRVAAHSGLTSMEAKQAVMETFTAIMELMASGQVVTVPGFGQFSAAPYTDGYSNAAWAYGWARSNLIKDLRANQHDQVTIDRLLSQYTSHLNAAFTPNVALNNEIRLRGCLTMASARASIAYASANNIRYGFVFREWCRNSPGNAQKYRRARTLLYRALRRCSKFGMVQVTPDDTRTTFWTARVRDVETALYPAIEGVTEFVGRHAAKEFLETVEFRMVKTTRKALVRKSMDVA